MFKVGDLVRYNPKWCSEGERKLLHMVKQVGLLNPVTNKETRVEIVTINSKRFMPPVELVEEDMIYGIGLTIEDVRGIYTWVS